MVAKSEAIFLSASVPDPKRGRKFAATADPVAIVSAVSALVHVTLGRRILVWGGHPAITPMIWIVASGLKVDYASWVRLYQSRFFKDDFPADNKRFNNVTYVRAAAAGRKESLLAMREKMFNDWTFSSAVFIGGMDGVVDEFKLLRRLQPDVTLVPVASTGGAARKLLDELTSAEPDLSSDLDYVALFHRHLSIPVGEKRYGTPTSQPAAIDRRISQPPRKTAR